MNPCGSFYKRKEGETMKLFSIITIRLLVAACESSSLVIVVIETTAGDIVVGVDTVAATITATNFLRYVDGGFYAGGTFYRSVRMDNQPDNDIRIEVIQGGVNTVGETSFFESIVLERTNKTGIRHLDGVISMARDGPDSATHSIFICIGDQPSLDFGGMRNPDRQGFGAFGHVISGMDLVRLIQWCGSRTDIDRAGGDRTGLPARLARAHSQTCKYRHP
jgi:peptidyl-prolyl cis-trans isomerase A (cyclophilin A)